MKHLRLSFFVCLFFVVASTYGQQRRIVIVPVASFVNEKIGYDYAFSVTRIHFDRKAKGFSAGGLIQFSLSSSSRISTGVLYKKTEGNNFLTTNVTTSSTGANPITFLYREVRKAVQIPLFLDYFPFRENRLTPCFSAAIVYTHRLNEPRSFFFVPEEKIPIDVFLSAGFAYKLSPHRSILIQPFIGYDFFKSRFFSNHVTRQYGLQIRVINSL